MYLLAEQLVYAEKKHGENIWYANIEIHQGFQQNQDKTVFQV